MAQFIGREEELGTLKSLLPKRSASLIVVKGRRRIGKSRLLEEFSKYFEKAYVFSGLAPTTQTTSETQQEEFGRQFARQFNGEQPDKKDWGDLFWALAKRTRSGKTLIILDEITWMGSKDPDFLGKLKNAWDLYFKKNDHLILALCGSVSAWIEKNILSSTGFLGRESLNLTLEEMPLIDCARFWNLENDRVSAYEKLKLLSVTGGIPRYLESINPAMPSEYNIQKLCFNKAGILFNEFEKIFSDLFSSKNVLYKSIVNCLLDGVADQATILTQVGLKKGGDISSYLDDLIKSGFIARDYTWQIKNGQLSRLSHYRLRDNYSRFYLKYVLPNRSKIELGNMNNITLSSLKGWYTIMGLQVENLILNNRQLIKKVLSINPNDVIFDNPFFQRRTARQLGCQVDYLIQTIYNTLYIFEIKFSKNIIGASIIDEMKNKVSRLKIPTNFSYRLVLIHVNGVSESVEESQYFSHIIDFSEFLKIK